jgi:hypothetical protein
MGEDKTRKKRRRVFRISYIFVGIFVFLFIAYVFYRFWLQDAYEQKLDQIRAAGYPATCAELDEWYSIPVGAENAADVFIDALRYLPNWDRKKRDNLFFVGRAPLPGLNEPISGDIKKQISELLEDNKQSFELLEKAVRIENCRFPVDLSAGYSALMPYLSEIRDAARILCLQAVYYAEEKKSQKALESIETALGVANLLSNEPVLISQLVSIACKNAAVDALEFALNRADFNDSQLIGLEKLLADSEDILSVQRGLVGERCLGIEMFNLPHLRIPVHTSRRFSFTDAIGLAMYRLSGMSDMDRLIYIDFMSDAIEASGLPLHQRKKVFDALESKINKLPKFHIVLQQVSPSLYGMLRRELTGMADIRVARACVAARRFYLERGRYPDRVSELVGDFLPAVPKDPFDGNDIRYKQLGTGCIIYSIGEDGFDSCGKLSELDIGAFGDDITFIIYK